MSPVACSGNWFACNYQWLIGSVVAILAAGATIAGVIVANRNRKRPIIWPMSDELSHLTQDGSVDWAKYYNSPPIPAAGGSSYTLVEPNTQLLVLKNMGDEVALNVYSFLYGPGGGLGPEYMYTSWESRPIQGNDMLQIVFNHGGTVLSEDTKVDGKNRLYDNSDPNNRIARLTTTYHDSFGKKYVSIFDYVRESSTGHHKWQHVRTKNNILSDLDELDDRERERQAKVKRKPIK